MASLNFTDSVAMWGAMALKCAIAVVKNGTPALVLCTGLLATPELFFIRLNVSAVWGINRL